MSDYELIFGLEGGESDLFLTNLELRNGYALNGELKYRNGYSDQLRIKVGVQRLYKHRHLILPLANNETNISLPALQIDKKANPSPANTVVVPAKLTKLAGVSG